MKGADWHIPRPALTSVSMLSLDDEMDLPNYRSATPTTFTLLSQSGVLIHSNYPTSCQLSFTVCSLALFALVAFIVYTEVYVRWLRN